MTRVIHLQDAFDIKRQKKKLAASNAADPEHASNGINAEEETAARLIQARYKAFKQKRSSSNLTAMSASSVETVVASRGKMAAGTYV